MINTYSTNFSHFSFTHKEFKPCLSKDNWKKYCIDTIRSSMLLISKIGWYCNSMYSLISCNIVIVCCVVDLFGFHMCIPDRTWSQNPKFPAARTSQMAASRQTSGITSSPVKVKRLRGPSLGIERGPNIYDIIPKEYILRYVSRN